MLTRTTNITIHDGHARTNRSPLSVPEFPGRDHVLCDFRGICNRPELEELYTCDSYGGPIVALSMSVLLGVSNHSDTARL
jgi:hypothetical protein